MAGAKLTCCIVQGRAGGGCLLALSCPAIDRRQVPKEVVTGPGFRAIPAGKPGSRCVPSGVHARHAGTGLQVTCKIQHLCALGCQVRGSPGWDKVGTRLLKLDLGFSSWGCTVEIEAVDSTM